MSFKEPLCFLGGLIVGGAIGVLAMRRRCDEQVNQAYEESRTYYNKKLAEVSAKNRNKPAPAELVKSIVKDDTEPAVVQKNPEKTNYTAYSTITKFLLTRCRLRPNPKKPRNRLCLSLMRTICMIMTTTR